MVSRLLLVQPLALGYPGALNFPSLSVTLTLSILPITVTLPDTPVPFTGNSWSYRFKGNPRELSGVSIGYILVVTKDTREGVLGVPGYSSGVLVGKVTPGTGDYCFPSSGNPTPGTYYSYTVPTSTGSTFPSNIPFP